MPKEAPNIPVPNIESEHENKSLPEGQKGDDQLQIESIAAKITNLATQYLENKPEQVEKVGADKLFALATKITFKDLQAQGINLNRDQKESVKAMIVGFKRGTETIDKKALRAERFLAAVDKLEEDLKSVDKKSDKLQILKKIAKLNIMYFRKQGMDLSKPAIINSSVPSDNIAIKPLADNVIDVVFRGESFQFKREEI
jgi:hypothetical protein